jgi:hypothetical protein
MRHLMKKAPNHPFALGALALSLAALFTACSSEATPPRAESAAPAPLAEELKSLQGHWESDGAGDKYSITIEGNSLVYRNAGGWYKTTFILPAGTDPRQLHVTIKECSPPSNSAIGAVVFTIYKIEDGTLTLETFDMSDEPPKTFEEASRRYTVKKVQPQKK